MSKLSPVRLPLLLAGLAGTALIVALLGSGFGKDPHAIPTVITAQPAAPFRLVDLDGKPVALADYAGKAVVLNFWSTWCLPCKVEHPLLQQAARLYGDRVVFLGVLYSDTPDKARAYVARAGAAYPTLVDPNGRTAIDYGVTGVPETFFISPDGVVQHKHAGPLDERTLFTLLGSP